MKPNIIRIRSTNDIEILLGALAYAEFDVAFDRVNVFGNGSHGIDYFLASTVLHQYYSIFV